MCNHKYVLMTGIFQCQEINSGLTVYDQQLFGQDEQLHINFFTKQFKN